jgi:hypothetical protein
MTGIDAELRTVLALVNARDAALVNIGHGRDAASVARAEAFTAAWQELGGQVGIVVSWPARAASWLRQARRFAAGPPDVWVIADLAGTWAGIAGRLEVQGWSARRTIAFSGLADPALPGLAGGETVEGLCGAGADGTEWTVFDGRLRRAPATSDIPATTALRSRYGR